MNIQLEDARHESWNLRKLRRLTIGSSVACLMSICLAGTLTGQTTITTDTTQSGGTVTTPGNGLLQITHGSNDPLLTLTGSAVRNSAAVVVGSLSGQSGQLLIESGSSLNNDMGEPFQNLGTIGSVTIFSQDGYIGLNAGSIGTVTVRGEGSAWNNDGLEISVGHSGSGSLAVEDGGLVSSRSGNVGRTSGALGTATISGPGSTWTNSSILNVGNLGSGTLVVENGGHVSSREGRIGLVTSSSGRAI